MNPSVAAVIATRHRPKELGRLLDSLVALEPPLSLVVIVDNGGDERIRESVKSSPLPIRLVTPGENLGCGGGLRRGEEAALSELGESCTHLLILDDDAVLRPDTLRVLLENLEREQAGAAYPVVIGPDGRVGWLPGLADRRQHRIAERGGTVEELRAALGGAAVRFTWAQGICLLVARRAVDEVGLHRADFWMRGEDLEFSLRLSARHPALFVLGAVAEHLPPPERPQSREAEYLKHCAMVQNIAYVSLRLPHGRRVAWTNLGTMRRFLSLWSWRAIGDAARAWWRGVVLGEPAGRGSGRTFFARLQQLPKT